MNTVQRESLGSRDELTAISFYAQASKTILGYGLIDSEPRMTLTFSYSVGNSKRK